MGWSDISKQEAQRRDFEFADAQRQLTENFNNTQRVEQNAWSEGMYNKYSSPAAMARQLKDAGLNPRLAAESGGASGGMSASSGSSSSMSPVSASGSGGDNSAQKLEAISSALNEFASATEKGIESNNMRRIIDKQIENLDIENGIRRIDYENAKTGGKKKYEAEVKKVVEDAEGAAKDNEIKDFNIKHQGEAFENEQNNVKSQTASNEANANFTNTQERRFDEITDANIRNLDSQTVVNQTLEKLNNAETAKAWAEAGLTNVKTETEGFLKELARYNSYDAQLGYTENKQTSHERIKARLSEYDEITNGLQDRLKALREAAEEAKKNNDYRLWDSIEGTIDQIILVTGIIFSRGKLAPLGAAAVAGKSGYSPSVGPTMRR